MANSCNKSLALLPQWTLGTVVKKGNRGVPWRSQNRSMKADQAWEQARQHCPSDIRGGILSEAVLCWFRTWQLSGPLRSLPGPSTEGWFACYKPTKPLRWHDYSTYHAAQQTWVSPSGSCLRLSSVREGVRSLSPPMPRTQQVFTQMTYRHGLNPLPFRAQGQWRSVTAVQGDSTGLWPRSSA